METMLRSVAMSGYFDVTRRFGLNPVELAQQVGIDPAALANADDRVPAGACCRLLELTAEKASCPTFALQSATILRFPVPMHTNGCAGLPP